MLAMPQILTGKLNLKYHLISIHVLKLLEAMGTNTIRKLGILWEIDCLDALGTSCIYKDKRNVK